MGGGSGCGVEWVTYTVFIFYVFVCWVASCIRFVYNAVFLALNLLAFFSFTPELLEPTYVHIVFVTTDEIMALSSF